MFKIVKTDEPLRIETINILIYGEPGSGKTSLVNTSQTPLTLDFDKGVHRSEFRKDVLVIESWRQINNNMSELIKTFDKYDTIILDTIDTLLDYIGAWIVEQEPKLMRNKLQFYGRLKDEFSLFVGKLKTLKKDVIMIAHVKEKDEGDFRIKRPAITGGSYDRVLQTADFAGYMYIRDNRRTIDFNPTDYWIGKNSAKFPSLNIPNFNSEPEYFANLISEMKKAINGRTQAQEQAVKLIKGMKERVIGMTNENEINAFMQEISGMKNGIKKQIWDKIQVRARELNLEFNSKDKKFYAKTVSRKTEKKPELMPNAEMISEPDFSFD